MNDSMKKTQMMRMNNEQWKNVKKFLLTSQQKSLGFSDQLNINGQYKVLDELKSDWK